MNWIKKTLKFGEKIKTIIKARATKSEISNSDWTSCCKGPILKKDLEENLWVCPSCNKHHRISPRQRFDIIFGKNNYEVLKTPIPQDDPLNWNDAKPYKDRLKAARKKTGMDCGMMVVNTNILNLKITAIASDFDFVGGSIGAAEGEAFLYGIQHAIENEQPFVVFTSGGGMRMMESSLNKKASCGTQPKRDLSVGRCHCFKSTLAKSVAPVKSSAIHPKNVTIAI